MKQLKLQKIAPIELLYTLIKDVLSNEKICKEIKR